MTSEPRWSRWLAPGVVAVIAFATIVLIGASLIRGPRLHLQGYIRIDLVDGQTCVTIETTEPGNPVWTIVQLPAGYSAVVESFDPRIAPGTGRITGPDDNAIRYLDLVDVDAVPVPTTSDDQCGANPAASLLAIKRSGIGP